MIPFLYFSLLYTITTAFNRDSIEDCSRVLSENIVDTFRRVTGEPQIVQFYEKYVEVEHFDPRVQLKQSKEAIEKYTKKRAHYTHKLKVSLENRELKTSSDENVNDPTSKEFIRFMSAKQGNDGTTIYEHTHLLTKVKVNESRNFNLVPNANFYTLPTSPAASAVHVPTPLYDRNPELLKKIEWSEIDDLFRSHREETRDLAFQLFCSESGYMRFYPAASWFWDNHAEHLDLFDCRNTEWYINAATNSKNVLIMLDMSGSMLGQRYEIAKQTTEAILETLSHNDYFNIMPFSKNAYFLDECDGRNGLLQATMRNKKALRNRMNNVTSEGKAEYEKAFPTAFNTLLNLPRDQWDLFAKEEFSKILETNESVREANLHYELHEHYITYTAEYLKAVSNANGNPEQGCENVIMLITDGAPNAYKDIFDLYNKDKKVRLFTFLIGEEAIDFEEVKEMACYNRGYMVHVQNMADVEEKVQHYIRTMSRPIGHHVKDIKEDGGAMWSGVYRERLYLPRPETFAEPVPITNHSFQIMNKMASKKKIRLQKTEARGRMFVTTVSYPVILNETFMGVAAVNIPLTEINQLAHPTLVGGKSYFFMLDQNGFIMTHPQLRPIDPASKTHKPNYNNMDILELEVPQSQQTRKMVLDCDNAEAQKLSMLYATEGLDRVYPQTNTYYAECIQGANFILGLAIADEDDNRIKSRNSNYDYSKVELEWMRDKQWRLHPHWRYCLLNDTDTNITKEEAFTTYAQQMKHSGALPKLCEPRKDLVLKMLVDLEATSALTDNWDQQWQFHKDNLIHLVFFSAPSGLIRFYNQTLDDFDYIDPYWNIFDHIGSWLSVDHAQESYNHFITDLHRKSADDEYYKRSVRMKDTIVFQVSNKSKIWYKSETHYTGYGHNENLTVLAQATKAIYMDKAVLGVTGYEFAYDYLVNVMSEHGCKPNDTRRWCVLLDEHGYVFYSNDKDISYEDYIEDPVNMGKHLGHWFGGINRVSQRAMQLLVERKFYTKTTYTDHQAICKQKKVISMSSSSLKPLRYIFKMFLSLVDKVLRLANFFSLYPLYSRISFAEAYTASFHDGGDGLPCSKVSNFYISNKDGRNRPTESTLIPNGRYDKPCHTTKCSVKMSASFIEGTNLVMVWIQQEDKSTSCYEEDACPKHEHSDISFEFVREYQKNEEKCTGEQHKRPKRSKAMCYVDEFYPKSEPCSGASNLVWKLFSVFILILLIRVL